MHNMNNYQSVWNSIGNWFDYCCSEPFLYLEINARLNVAVVVIGAKLFNVENLWANKRLFNPFHIFKCTAKFTTRIQCEIEKINIQVFKNDKNEFSVRNIVKFWTMNWNGMKKQWCLLCDAQ